MLEAVRRELDAIGQASLKIIDEGIGPVSIALAHGPATNEFAVGIDGRPSPNITSPFRWCFGVDNVLVLRVHEAPDFIALNAFRLKVTNAFVMEVQAELASVFQELRDGIDRDIADAGNRPHRAAFAEHREDLNALGYGQLVHAHNI
jgi:hypothetical protein